MQRQTGRRRILVRMLGADTDDVTDYGFEPEEYEADLSLYGLFALGLFTVGVGVALLVRNRLG